MAPTVCLAEFPTAGSTVNAYARRRQKTQSIGNIVKRQTLTLGQIPQTEIIGETPLTLSHADCPRKLYCTNTVADCFVLDENTKHPASVDEQRRKFIAARKDLLNIVARTITLIRRNRILQRRLNALRAETCRYLRSASENQRRQRRLLQASRSKDEIVSSSTDTVVWTSSLLLGPTRNSFHGVIAFRDHAANDDCLSNNFDDSVRNGC